MTTTPSDAANSYTCSCWPATLRTTQQTSDISANSRLTLSDMLTLSHNLVQQWELLNGCVNSESHLNTATFGVVVDAVGRVLALFETAVDGSGSGSVSRWSEGGERRVLSFNTTSTFVGGLELEDEQECAVVGQEALRHAVIRLGAVLQDVEEEARLSGGSNGGDDGVVLLGRQVKELIGRLFRLLGRVDALAV